MWPPANRRPPQPAQTEPLYVVVRDSAIKLVSMALLAITTWAVVYMAREVPLALQRHELKFQTQEQFNSRIVGILEQNERRDDAMETRLIKLERDR